MPKMITLTNYSETRDCLLVELPALVLKRPELGEGEEPLLLPSSLLLKRQRAVFPPRKKCVEEVAD